MALKFLATWIHRTAPALICGGIAACGSSGGSAPAGAAAPAAAQTHRAGEAADDMVEAVGAGHDQSMDLKFALRERPAVGQPLHIAVRLTPRVDLDSVETHIRADEGIELRSGTAFPALDHPQRAVPVEQEIIAVPAHDGVYSIMVTATMTSPGASLSRSFAIPLIVGTGGTLTSGGSEPAPPAKTGNP